MSRQASVSDNYDQESVVSRSIQPWPPDGGRVTSEPGPESVTKVGFRSMTTLEDKQVTTTASTKAASYSQGRPVVFAGCRSTTQFWPVAAQHPQLTFRNGDEDICTYSQETSQIQEPPRKDIMSLVAFQKSALQLNRRCLIASRSGRSFSHSVCAWNTIDDRRAPYFRRSGST